MMRSLFVLLSVLSILSSNEIKRLETIVKEVTELRTKYEACQEELLKSRKNGTDDKYEVLTQKIKKLEKIVKKQDELLKLKENIVKNQSFTVKKCDEDNIFPKLMMKEEYQDDALETPEFIDFKPAAFHLNVDSFVYDGIDGNKIEKWEKDTSFTSGVKTKKWIKITGYFVDRKWKRAKKEMWIELEKVSKKNIKDGR